MCMYIYGCGHSGQSYFPDPLWFGWKVVKTLFELQVLGVNWMHCVIVMCFVLARGPWNINVSFGTSACLRTIFDEVAIEFIPAWIVATLEPRPGVAGALLISMSTYIYNYEFWGPKRVEQFSRMIYRWNLPCDFEVCTCPIYFGVGSRTTDCDKKYV